MEADPHPQDDSPLFAAIPPEVRNRIFQYALSGTYDFQRPYSGHTYYYRPGYRYEETIHTALLRTCKAIYAETRLLPWRLKEHVFWFFRGPPVTTNQVPESYFGALTEAQRADVGQVHIFAQAWWLEGHFPNVCASGQLCARSLVVTLRNSDWWYWEHNQVLSLKDEWIRNVNQIKGLKEMRLELECVQRDYEQLMAIVRDVLRWRIKASDGRVLTTEGNPISQTRWLGSSHPEPGLLFDNVDQKWIRWRPRGSRHNQECIFPCAPVTFVVVTVKWT